MIISVITPVFNSSGTISRNVNSILSQSYGNFEHVIIDNLSQDNSLSIIKKLYSEKGELESHLKIISEPDKGISDAFNKGIKNSSGEIIGILNSDDFFYDNNVLKRVADEFNNKDTMFVHGNIFFDDPIYGSNIRKPLLCPVTEAMPYNHPTMFFRRNVYETFGGYDTLFKYAMDFEFICRISKISPKFLSNGIYMDNPPLVHMKAGGATWENEAESLVETRIALKKHGLWNLNASWNHLNRMLRISAKSILYKLNLHRIVTFWRNKKWK